MRCRISETEQALQQCLMELARDRTTLVIVHRLATIQNADRIVVIDDSGMVEQGRHQELPTSDGYYRRLHAAQYAARPS